MTNGFFVILCQKEKNDHIFHNTYLTYIIKFYDDERIANREDRIINNIIHTDNCPDQYKCHQNIYHVVTAIIAARARNIHKFSQKYKFKGSWDATGKLIKDAILKNELKIDRSTTI